jgi:hypothetical protein
MLWFVSGDALLSGRSWVDQLSGGQVSPHWIGKEVPMSVNVWVGREPQGYEAQVLRQVIASALAAERDCHLFANFIVGGREIDLLVVKPNALFLVELKQVGGAVTGAINGQWTVGGDRNKALLPGGSHENPYQQLLAQYRVLTEWLEEHKALFLNEYAARVTLFRPAKRGDRLHPPVKIRSLLAFYPTLPRGSELRLDWKVEPVSAADLSAIVVQETTPRVNLTPPEIGRLAELLNLTPWTPQLTQPVMLAAVHRPPKVIPSSSWALTLDQRWRRWQLTVLESLILWLARHRQTLRQQLAQAGPPSLGPAPPKPTPAGAYPPSWEGIRLEAIGR